MPGVSTGNLPQGRVEVATLILAGTSAPFGCQRLAGVIGRKRFLYDLWGDGVNVQLRKHAAPVRSLRRMPAAFASTIDACLEPDPADRPTVADIEAILEPLAGNV
jgi:hypothetical protein